MPLDACTATSSVCASVRERCLLHSLSPQAYRETTTHSFCFQQECVSACIYACARVDVNEIGHVERLNGHEDKGFLCFFDVCQSICDRPSNTHPFSHFNVGINVNQCDLKIR